MKTFVWTYVNKKPKVFELDRYYYLRNRRELWRLVDRLMDIDAVSRPVPGTYKFPVIMELKPGFAPTLELVDEKDLINARKEVSKLLSKVRRDK